MRINIDFTMKTNIFYFLACVTHIFPYVIYTKIKMQINIEFIRKIMFFYFMTICFLFHKALFAPKTALISQTYIYAKNEL